jgi:hypothetical protein
LQLLDIVYLKDPIHFREYLAEQLLSVTNNFNITKYIFMIIQDNATTNNLMLDMFEETAREQYNKKLDNL